MRNKVVYILICFIPLVACNGGSSYEHISAMKSAMQRVNNLNKSVAIIKKMEDEVALSRQENNFIEYEYPIRDNESYVVGYRFRNGSCIQVILTTYFNRSRDARHVAASIEEEIETAGRFSVTSKENDCYSWKDINDSMLLDLDKQHLERGTVMLIVSINE